VVPKLVSDVEVLWVVAAHEPATISGVAELLPIAYHTTKTRLRTLGKRGDMVRDDSTRPYTHELTERGRDRVRETDLPEPTPEAVVTYFEDTEGERGETPPADILAAMASLDGEWHETETVISVGPLKKHATLPKLNDLVDAGHVERREGAGPYPDEWRVTEAGHAALADESGDT
jgi:hypothetical protein